MYAVVEVDTYVCNTINPKLLFFADLFAVFLTSKKTSFISRARAIQREKKKERDTSRKRERERERERVRERLFARR